MAATMKAADRMAGPARPLAPWERPDYTPAPRSVRRLRAAVRFKAEELRALLAELAERLDSLDLSDVTNGFTSADAANAARAARACEWAVEAGVSQVEG